MNCCRSGVDPGFELVGCPKWREIFFSATYTHFQVHNQVWAPWNCDIIITIGIKKHEVVENYNFEALCGHCMLLTLLMQEQGDCYFKHKNLAPFSN